MLEYVLGLENTDKKIREAVGRTLRTKISMFVRLTTMPMKKNQVAARSRVGAMMKMIMIMMMMIMMMMVMMVMMVVMMSYSLNYIN